ncbi:hypothetical protein Tco_0963232 [Tanacetum coccineum]
MAESSSQFPQQQKQIKQQDQQERPASPIPFAPINQVGFNLKYVFFNPNNEGCLRETFTRSPNQYKEYLSEFWYSAKAFKNSKVCFSTPTSGIFGEMKGYGDGDVTLNPTQVFSVNNWALKPNQPKGPSFTDHMLAIWAADKHVVLKASKTSSKDEKKDYKGKKPGAKTRSSKIQTRSKSMETKDGSSKVPTGSQSGHFEMVSSLALDTNLSQPPASIPVDVGMHKKDQQESASFIIHSESTSGRDASADSTDEAGLGKSAPNDSIPQQQGMDEGTQNNSFDQLSAGTGPNVLTDKTQSEASLGGDKFTSSNEIFKKIKLEDLSKLVQNVKADFMDLDFPEDDPIIMVDESEEDEEEKDEEVHATSNVETKDTSAPKPPPPSSLPTELKDLPSKFNDLTKEVKGLKKHVHELYIELPVDLKEIPTKVEEFTTTVSNLTTQVAELKTLHLLNKVTEALNQFAQAIASASKKTKDANVPLANQAGTKLAEGEKNTNQATISQLFQRKAAKDANLNKQQSIPTSQITTTATSTTSLQSSFISNPLKSSTQTKGEHIKKDKGKKAMSLKNAKEKSSDSKSNDTINLTGSRVESSRMKKLKKFDFVTGDGDHVHLTEEQIKEQKRIEESAKVEAAKHEVEVRKEELVDLLGPDVVYREDGTSEVIPNFKAIDLHLGEWREVVQACPIIKGKGWSANYEQIKTTNDYLHETKVELGINLDKPHTKEDLLDKLNDLVNKKIKHADDIHDYFRANKRLKLSVQYEDHPAGTMLNEPVLEIFFRLHQGLGLFDHARTFSSLLLAEVDKRNLYPLKQFESLRKVQLQFFWYLEDQDHLHFSLCGDIETEDETLARASVQLGW